MSNAAPAIDWADDARGKGLDSLYERAAAIGARLVVHSVPGRTVVEIRLR